MRRGEVAGQINKSSRDVLVEFAGDDSAKRRETLAAKLKAAGEGVMNDDSIRKPTKFT